MAFSTARKLRWTWGIHWEARTNGGRVSTIFLLDPLLEDFLLNTPAPFATHVQQRLLRLGVPALYLYPLNDSFIHKHIYLPQGHALTIRATSDKFTTLAGYTPHAALFEFTTHCSAVFLRRSRQCDAHISSSHAAERALRVHPSDNEATSTATAMMARVGEMRQRWRG